MKPLNRNNPDWHLYHADRAWPKWPQMQVKGARVTFKQASEIIRRTDLLFGYCSGWYSNDEDATKKILLDAGFPFNSEEDSESVKVWENFRGTIHTGYVSNDWLASCFYAGGHGWCHPDGVIGFVDNVGKWPELHEIIHDWQYLACMFPFLDLMITMVDQAYDNESEVIGGEVLCKIRVMPEAEVFLVPLNTPNPFGEEEPDAGRGKKVPAGIIKTWGQWG